MRKIPFALALPLLFAGVSTRLAASESAQMVLEEIVVTAQKREQSIQDVPIAITAFDGNMLENNGATNLVDLNGIAPNVILPELGLIPNIGKFAIRGIAFLDPDPNADPKTGISLDAQRGRAQRRLRPRTGGDSARTSGHPVRPQQLGRHDQHGQCPAHRGSGRQDQGGLGRQRPAHAARRCQFRCLRRRHDAGQDRRRHPGLRRVLQKRVHWHRLGRHRSGRGARHLGLREWPLRRHADR